MLHREGYDFQESINALMDIVLKIILSPVLLPATVVTIALALVTAALTAIIHGIALAGDYICDDEKQGASMF